MNFRIVLYTCIFEFDMLIIEIQYWIHVVTKYCKCHCYLQMILCGIGI